jgi:hypothetical protein
MDSKGASLTTQCLAFCQSLAGQGKAFSFTLTIGSTFSFSLDTKEEKKKRPSPSTEKRNLKRREEFLKGKTDEPLEKEKAPKGVEKPGTKKVKKPEKSKYFKCDQCDSTFLTDNGLKVHIEMMHQTAEPVHRFKCVKCTYAVENEDRLVNHMMLVHGYLL